MTWISFAGAGWPFVVRLHGANCLYVDARDAVLNWRSYRPGFVESRMKQGKPLSPERRYPSRYPNRAGVRGTRGTDLIRASYFFSPKGRGIPEGGGRGPKPTAGN